MTDKFIMPLIIIVILLTLSNSCAQAETRNLSPKDWRADLGCLAEELPRRHCGMFFQMSRHDFYRLVEQLDRDIPKLKDHQVITRMMEIIAGIGDGHTSLANGSYSKFKACPLVLYWFSDGMFVIGAQAIYKTALGKKVVRIGNTAVDSAYFQACRLIPRENESILKLRSPGILTTPAYLNSLGIISTIDSCCYTLEDSCGNLTTTLIPAIALDSTSIMETLPDTTNMPLYLTNRKNNYWYQYLEPRKTIYMQYNKCEEDKQNPFGSFVAELFNFIDAHKVAKLVIDLRNNRGGTSTVINPLLKEIALRQSSESGPQLYVIIGRRTFSSAVLNVIALKQSNKAILVGEPTGNRPRHFGQVEKFTLPKSGIIINYSTKHFMRGDDRPSIFPDIQVSISSSDYLAGIDPVLEKILEM